jgi:hypothetical protein
MLIRLITHTEYLKYLLKKCLNFFSVAPLLSWVKKKRDLQTYLTLLQNWGSYFAVNPPSIWGFISCFKSKKGVLVMLLFLSYGGARVRTKVLFSKPLLGVEWRPCVTWLQPFPWCYLPLLSPLDISLAVLPADMWLSHPSVFWRLPCLSSAPDGIPPVTYLMTLTSALRLHTFSEHLYKNLI